MHLDSLAPLHYRIDRTTTADIEEVVNFLSGCTLIQQPAYVEIGPDKVICNCGMLVPAPLIPFVTHHRECPKKEPRQYAEDRPAGSCRPQCDGACVSSLRFRWVSQYPRA